MIFSKLLSCLALALPAVAAPASQAVTPRDTAAASDGWWLADASMHLSGAPFQTNGTYNVFRNVKDYGAVGDGSTDDTAAINAAIADGGRCGQNCESSTVTPALVYFPSGTYVVSTPILQYYYTQLVGDAISLPVIKASASFTGMAVIDADPYTDEGDNWWVNQNNFFRQIRNFEIDLTAMDYTSGAGIHWQVAQATSLQNIVFNMRTDGGAANAQKGIFMDNGSGGFMSDLTFNGGGYGAFFGNQQFTTRNLTFKNCQTAIYMNWNWAWTLKDVTIDSCQVGIDMANGVSTQTVGSVIFLDSKISNTPVGVNTSYVTTESSTNGTLIIDNVDMSSNVDIAVKNARDGSTVLAGNQMVKNFLQGNDYSSGTKNAIQSSSASSNSSTKPTVLTNSDGSVFTRSKPQYESVAASSFVSVKAKGAKGDASTDDTAAIQSVIDSATDGQIIYFNHGAYVVTDTIKIPGNSSIKIVGETWPMIMAKGDKFSDQANPIPVFQVGQAGDTGAVEISDMILETAGPAPGAIMIQWNLKGSENGAAGMWDVHTRIGGSQGTDLQLSQCAKNPNATHGPVAECEGAFMLMHITESASNVYLENTWFWVADHDLELGANSQQIDLYNGRGVLIESNGPVWLYGTASEHSQMYNYQLSNASNVFMSLIQTETAYMQGNPDAAVPFTQNNVYNDPSFSSCTTDNCARTWGLRVTDSSDVYVYGAGLYSFFDNYNQDCLETESCQTDMVSIENSAVNIYGLSTKASVNMLTVNGKSQALDSDNRNNFCATLSYFASTA